LWRRETKLRREGRVTGRSEMQGHWRKKESNRMVLVERRRGFDWVIDVVLIGRYSLREVVTDDREVIAHKIYSQVLHPSSKF
jgi:hypothetical protein